MASLKNVLTAVTDFLNEVQTLGIIKKFTLTQSDVNYEEFSGSCADELLSKFLQKINDARMSDIPTKSSPVADHIQKQKLVEANAIEPPVKNNLVQIQVDTTEMNRRISAFISRKRKEVDEWNVQEFCGRAYIDERDPSWEHLDSCARVDALYVPRRDSKSHIRVTKVVNRWGPQTHLRPEAKKVKRESCEEENQQNDATLEAIEERLQNMESHLKLKTDSSLRANIFERLKDLEDKILLLEGLSPEYVYLSGADSSPKKKSHSEKEKIYSNCSMDELQKRIQTLKETFKLKSPLIKTEPPI